MNQIESDWKLFRKRGPVNFMSPRALRCRLNKAIVALVTKDEAVRLLQARNHDNQYWLSICDEIESRLKDEGKF